MTKVRVLEAMRRILSKYQIGAKLRREHERDALIKSAMRLRYSLRCRTEHLTIGLSKTARHEPTERIARTARCHLLYMQVST